MWNFRELRIWHSGRELAKISYRYCELLPEKERFGFCSQIQRAAVSIPANIAEGASRSSLKDFKRFLEIAIGSCFELETLLGMAGEIYQIDEAKTTPILDKILILEKQINAMKVNLSPKKYQSPIPNPQSPA